MLLEDVNVNYLKLNDNVEIKRALPYVTRMSSVCHSYVLVCHPYVIRIYSNVTRMLFYHEPLRNGFTQVVTKSTRITMENYTTNLGSQVVTKSTRIAMENYTTNLGTLISKLKFYGINDNEMSWFCDYLDYNRKKSSKYPLLTGLPQGPILGSLLFVIFFNDFEDCLGNSEAIIYAEDNVVYYVASDINILERKMNEDFKYIAQYLDDSE